MQLRTMNLEILNDIETRFKHKIMKGVKIATKYAMLFLILCVIIWTILMMFSLIYILFL